MGQAMAGEAGTAGVVARPPVLYLCALAIGLALEFL